MFVFVWNCLIFFLGKYSSVWREIYRVLSQIQSRFFRGISWKNYFGSIFLKFCEKTLSSRKMCEISPYFLQLFSRSIFCLKFTKVLSYVVCTLLRRHIQKKSQIWVIVKKIRTYCFQKTGFVYSRSVSDYALFLGSSGLKILPDIRHCVYCVLGEIWSPDSSHKIFNKFFIHHCECWKECSFLCETVWFFS